MCGIHLIIQKSGDLQDGNVALEKMIASAAHRGPNGQGFVHLDWGEEQIYLGHNLLAISESAAKAKQPMRSADGRFGIIFNGEIYNHKELRARLEEHGYRFQTQSDTETLLAWLQEFGRKGLRKLRGMFAFVFWDSKKQLLILHRDGYGIKPLFYARNRHFLVFSSEPAALHASGLFKFSFDIQAIQLFFQFKFIPAPLSPWHGLKSLMPGETIEYWEGKPMHFQIQRETELQIFESLDQAIRAGFEEVIPRHKPTGLMLSGGIDSSLILKHCLEQEVAFEAFSIRFPFGDEEDKADQNAVFHLSKKLEIPIHWVDIDKSHWEEFLNGSGKNVPFVADSAWYLSSKIAGKARQNGLNVLLSGAGADEWFAGYRRHWFFHQWLRYHGFVPESLQRHLLRRFSKLPLFFSPNSQLTASQIWELGLSSGLASLFQKPMEFKRIFGSEVDTLEKALKWDQTQFLPNDVLTISDLATMQHGVEGRFPFLHPFITDFTEAIPALEKIKKGRKWMLKESLLPLVGRPFVERKKRGFGFPIGICLEGPTIRPWLEDILQQNLWTEFFDTEKWNLGKKELLAKPKLWSQEWLMLIRAWQWMQ